MTKQYLKPLALALSVALVGTACSKHDEADTAAGNTPAAASTAPAAASTTAAAAAKPSFDVSELDSGINACDDFNGFVNSKWVAANPIPDDRTRWGAFDQLAENSLNTQHDIVDAADKGADNAKAGSIEQKIGLIYRSGMNLSLIHI